MKLTLTTITLTLAFILTLATGLTLGLSTHVSAQTNGCGPLSRWTGTVCVAPKGKTYCPEGMTMEGQACVSTPSRPAGALAPTATAQQAVMRPTDDSDHQLIIRMLTTLTNQVTAQQAQITDLQNKLTALTIIDNLTLSNLNRDSAIIKTDDNTLNTMSTSLGGLDTDIKGVGTTLTFIQTGVTQTMTTESDTNGFVKDMGRRLYVTCYMASLTMKGGGAGSCVAGFWESPFNTMFNTPFGGPPK